MIINYFQLVLQTFLSRIQIDVNEFSNEGLEISSDKDDTVFSYTDLKWKNKIISKQQVTQIPNNSENLKDIHKSKSLNIAKLLDTGKIKLVESNMLQDGTIAYKYARVYNDYEYDFDFILVILDAESGETIQVSKRFVSKKPNKLNIGVTSSFIKNKSIEILSQKGIKDINQVEIKTVIANKPSNKDLQINKETYLSYRVSIAYRQDNQEKNMLLYFDCDNGNLVQAYI